jgi:hypothetical protein
MEVYIMLFKRVLSLLIVGILAIGCIGAANASLLPINENYVDYYSSVYFMSYGNITFQDKYGEFLPDLTEKLGLYDSSVDIRPKRDAGATEMTINLKTKDPLHPYYNSSLFNHSFPVQGGEFDLSYNIMNQRILSWSFVDGTFGRYQFSIFR